MQSKTQRVDIAEIPEILRIAREVRRTGVPCILYAGDEEVAIVRPPELYDEPDFPSGEPGVNDWLLAMIGMLGSDDSGPNDISENVDKYLAQAYYEEFHPTEQK